MLYKLAAPRKVFFWPAFVTRILTPRSRKSGYGLLLGCRSGLDAGGHENNFFCMLFLLKKTVKSSSDGRAQLPTIAIDRAWSNQSGGSP